MCISMHAGGVSVSLMGKPGPVTIARLARLEGLVPELIDLCKILDVEPVLNR